MKSCYALIYIYALGAEFFSKFQAEFAVIQGFSSLLKTWLKLLHLSSDDEFTGLDLLLIVNYYLDKSAISSAFPHYDFIISGHISPAIYNVLPCKKENSDFDQKMMSYYVMANFRCMAKSPVLLFGIIFRKMFEGFGQATLYGLFIQLYLMVGKRKLLATPNGNIVPLLIDYIHGRECMPEHLKNLCYELLSEFLAMQKSAANSFKAMLLQRPSDSRNPKGVTTESSPFSRAYLPWLRQLIPPCRFSKYREASDLVLFENCFARWKDHLRRLDPLSLSFLLPSCTDRNCSKKELTDLLNFFGANFADVIMQDNFSLPLVKMLGTDPLKYSYLPIVKCWNFYEETPLISCVSAFIKCWSAQLWVENYPSSLGKYRRMFCDLLMLLSCYNVPLLDACTYVPFLEHLSLLVWISRHKPLIDLIYKYLSFVSGKGMRNLVDFASKLQKLETCRLDIIECIEALSREVSASKLFKVLIVLEVLQKENQLTLKTLTDVINTTSK